MSTTFNFQREKKPKENTHPEIHNGWFCSETGIYRSKHPSIPIPSNPTLDVVTFIFSNKHNGVSALIDSSTGSSISYAQLFPLVKSMASGLHHKMGISKGDVVLILLPNSINFPIIFMSILYLGAIASTMNPLSSVTEIKKQTRKLNNVSLAFTVPENFQKFQALRIPTIGVPNHKADFNSRTDDFSIFYQLISMNSHSIPRPVINQQDPAAILYSSGTTGATKGVVLTHGNLIASVELFVRFEASQYKDLPSLDNVYLDVLPMFHIYGLSLFVVGLLSLGSTIVVMRKFDINEVVNAIDRYGVTHFPVVPPILMALTAKAKAFVGGNGNGNGKGLKSLKQVSSGAATLSRKIMDEFVGAFPNVDFIQGYGLTESTAVGTRGFNTKNIQKYSSVGLLAPNMQAKVVDWITGSFLPPGSCGELWLRGPAIMKGYLNDVEATTSTIDKDGWLHTGDIVYFEQDGYLYVIDRLKEIIKYKGFQIAPADLEAVLISHPEILDVAVTAAKDEEAGEVPVAFVVRRKGSMLSETAIIDYVGRQVAPHKKVRKVVFIQSLPKSPAGKVLRRELRNNMASRM